MHQSFETPALSHWGIPGANRGFHLVFTWFRFLARPVARFFLTGRCDPTRRRTKQGWRHKSWGGGGGGGVWLGCLRLHQEGSEKHGYFWSLCVSQSFKSLKVTFLQRDYCIFAIPENDKVNVTIKKEKQNSWKSVLFARFAAWSLCIIMRFPFAKLKSPWVLLRNRSTTSFRSMNVR